MWIKRGKSNCKGIRKSKNIKIVTMSKAHLSHKLIYGDDEELVIATLEDLRETLHIMQNITGMSLHSFVLVTLASSFLSLNLIIFF